MQHACVQIAPAKRGMSKNQRKRVARAALHSAAGQAPIAADGHAVWPSQNSGSPHGGRQDDDMQLDFSCSYGSDVPLPDAELYAPAYLPPLPEPEEGEFGYSPRLSTPDQHTAYNPPLPDTEGDIPWCTFLF